MKDLTHYFQAPKTTPTSSKRTPTKTASKCKRKASESVDGEGAKSTICNGDTPEEEIIKTKKARKSNPSSKKKPAKANLNDSSNTDNNISDDEDTPISKRLKKCNGDIFNDSTPKSNPSSKKKPAKSNLNDSSNTDNNIISDDEDTPISKRLKKCNGDIFNDSTPVKKVRTYQNKKKLRESAEVKIDPALNGVNFDVRIVLQDCMEKNSPEIRTNVSVETEGSDSDSCFVSSKKPKKSSKPKNEKEDEPEKNNLLNYFSKVDKTQAHQKKNHKNYQTTITVKAIVHSPPKDKSKLIKERDPNVPEISSVPNKNSKKKKSCNFDSFDEIKVVETEIIEVEDGNLKVSQSCPTTPKPQAENVSPGGSSSKGKSWKMRVKLTPSSKLDEMITKKSKPKKYSKIIVQSSSDEEDTETKNDSKSIDNEVEFVSITKLEIPAKPDKVEKQQPIKLAPLFCKRKDTKNNTSNKSRINDEARRQFLESGVPEALKKKMEEQKNIVVEEEYKGEYVFPKCNHVQQKDTESFVWNLKECSDFKLKQETDFRIEEFSSKSFSSLITTDVKIQPEQNHAEEFKFDLKDEINSLKKQEPNANVSDIHSSIKRLKKVSESLNDICWTQKYKPFVFGDMIGNTNSLVTLKEWIESHKNKKQVFLESDYSSGGEFLDSDDSNSSTNAARNNVAILVGPPGCGKTCAVYMLANELGFKVLEVNAGWNRAGKKIIDELLEATQSHRVKRTSGSIFDSKPEKSRKKKKGKETKKEKKTMSLILIEDADILFENYDEGFLSALNSLTSLSKRPLIFTVNNLNYPHLHKYNNSQNLVLRFDYPPRSLINSWLKIIALLEGVQLTDEVLIELYKIAGSDLRKNLLQLQMLVQSKCQYPKSNNEQLFYQDWLSHVRCLGDKRIPPKVAITNGNPQDELFGNDETTSLDNFKKPPSKDDDYVKPKSKTELRNHREALLESAKFLDCAANLDNFFSDNDVKIFPSRGGLAKNENYFTYRINCDIAEFIKNKIFEKFEEKKAVSFKKYYNAVAQNSRINTVTENVFTSFNPHISNRQARNCDYLPLIREIARSEKNKTSATFSSTRRSNRYFGYLKSISIDISDKETEILCNTFAL